MHSQRNDIPRSLKFFIVCVALIALGLFFFASSWEKKGSSYTAHDVTRTQSFKNATVKDSGVNVKALTKPTEVKAKLM